MTPIFQTKYPPQYPVGNCLAAVLASVFDLPIQSVPNVEVLADVPDNLWALVANTWVLSKGYILEGSAAVLAHHNGEAGARFPASHLNALYIATGKVGDVQHAGIYANGILVHDPTMTGAGLDTFEEVLFFRKVPTYLGEETGFGFTLGATAWVYSDVPQVPDYDG